MPYDGYTLRCGCHCKVCNNRLKLEGFDDAHGAHYCEFCDNYVPTRESHCNERTPEKIQARQNTITENESQ